MADVGIYRGGTNSQVLYDNPDYVANDAASRKAAAWLKTVFVNALVHKSSIVLGALLNGTNTVTNIHRFGKIGEALTNVVAGVGSVESFLEEKLTAGVPASTAMQEANAILDELKNPNLGGIPIHADTEIEAQDTDISQHLLINQDTRSKHYVADNVAIKPKTWTIKGYLMASRTSLDSQLIIKPSLTLQKSILQRYADARMPVVFKTHDNHFYTVLISHIDTAYVIQALNAIQINLTLTEFNAMTMDSESAALAGALQSVKE